MSGYQDWCLSGWRTHLPGVTDVTGYVARLGSESLPAPIWNPLDMTPGGRGSDPDFPAMHYE